MDGKAEEEGGSVDLGPKRLSWEHHSPSMNSKALEYQSCTKLYLLE